MEGIDKRGIVLVIGLALIFLWFRPRRRPQILVPPTEEVQAETDYLEIPKISVKAPISYPDSSDEAAIQDGLERGVVHYFGTAEPGETGNAYLVGHSSDYAQAPGDFKTVFAGLPKLAVGDEIRIRHNNEILIYEVTATKVVEATDLSVLDQAADGVKILTLQTSYPVGTAQKRFLVIAKMSEK